jgi:hypothetical protein
MKSLQTSKTFLLLLFLFLVSSHWLLGQSYHPFPAGRLHLYSFSQFQSADTWLFAAGMDTVMLEGVDSAYYLYRIDRPAYNDPELDCAGQSLPATAVVTNKDHYFGKKMRLQPNGDCTFEFSNGDTFLLQSQATAGATWNWNAGITATVDSIVARAVLGVVDSVKCISLSNGKSLELSKAHGLVKFFNLGTFVNHTGLVENVEFTLWGIPAPGLGGHLPSLTEVYQLDVGDKFGSYYHLYQSFGTTISRWKQQEVLSLVSQFQYQILSEKYQEDRPQSGPMQATYSPPTTVTAGQATGSSEPNVSLLPYQHNSALVTIGYNHLQKGVRLAAGMNGRITLDFEHLSSFDTCAQAHVGGSRHGAKRLVQGLGLIFNYHYESGDGYYYDSIYCYQKGSESWGTCLDLSTMLAVEPQTLSEFSLSPNPANTYLHLQLDATMKGIPGTIDILSLEGRNLASYPIGKGQSSHEISVADLPAGMYLLRVSGRGLPIAYQRFVIER